MFLKNFIFKQAQNVNVYLPTGVGTDGEKIYGNPQSSKAVILSSYEEKRDEVGKVVSGVKFLFLDYVPEGAKIEWDGKVFHSKKMSFFCDFKGLMIGYEVEV